MKIPYLLFILLTSLLFIACQRTGEVLPTPTTAVEPIKISTLALLQTFPPTSPVTATTAPPATNTPPPPLSLPTRNITLGLVGKLTSLNPLLDLNLTLSQLSPLLYQSLNQIDPLTAQPHPNWASLPTLAENGLTLTYTVAHSSSGSSNIGDIQASLKTAIWPVLAGIEAINQPQPDVLTLRLAEPNCALVDRLAQLPILTRETITREIPLGTGPFELAQWDAVENELHFMAKSGGGIISPRLETITVRLFATESLAWNALQAGDLDILSVQTLPGDLPAGYRYIAYPAPALTFISFNHQDEILMRPPVRQALSLALDRAHILVTVFTNQGDFATGPLHPNHWAADRDISIPSYNPTQAASLLDEAGLIDRNGDGWRDHPNGETWHLSLRAQGNDEPHAAIALLVAEAYRQLGIQARAELRPWGTILDDLLTHDYQLAVYEWPVFPELNQHLYWHSDQIGAEFGLNVAAYTNPQVDDWLDEVNRTPACDPTRRLNLYRQIQTQLAMDHAYDFLVVPHHFLIARENIQGLAPGPFAPFTWNAETWYVE